MRISSSCVPVGMLLFCLTVGLVSVSAISFQEPLVPMPVPSAAAVVPMNTPAVNQAAPAAAPTDVSPAAAVAAATVRLQAQAQTQAQQSAAQSAEQLKAQAEWPSISDIKNAASSVKETVKVTVTTDLIH